MPSPADSSVVSKDAALGSWPQGCDSGIQEVKAAGSEIQGNTVSSRPVWMPCLPKVEGTLEASREREPKGHGFRCFLLSPPHGYRSLAFTYFATPGCWSWQREASRQIKHRPHPQAANRGRRKLSQNQDGTCFLSS